MKTTVLNRVLYPKRLLLSLSLLLLTNISSFADQLQIGEYTTFRVSPPEGWINTANWQCSRGELVLIKSGDACQVWVANYFPDQITVTCTAYYSYQTYYNGRTHIMTGSFTRSFYVTCVRPTISLTPTEATIQPGEQVHLKLTTTPTASPKYPIVRWTISDYGLAGINLTSWSEENGYSDIYIDTFQNPGECVVTADIGGGLTASCKITIGGIPKPIYEEGDKFVVETEDVKMSFKVISNAEKTCEVSGPPAIPRTTSGIITIPSDVNGYKVKKIGDSAFLNCSLITKINLPNTLESIGVYAFEGCYQLMEINGTENIEIVGEGAFKDASWYDKFSDGIIYIGKALYNLKGSLPPNTEVFIKEGTKSITSGAFSDCSGLSAIYIPKSLSSITGYFPFANCPNLDKIEIDTQNTTFDSRNNCNAIILTNENKLVVGCKSTKIPNSVTSIGNYAFWECPFDSIDIPDNVRHIGYRAFTFCNKLKSISIGNGVSYIEEEAFRDCNSLVSIYTILVNPSEIHDKAFPETIYDNAKLYVPYGTRQRYESIAGWKNFKTIVEFNPTVIHNVSIKRPVNSTYYSLSGQKLSTPKKGINLINGRKILVK